MIVVQSKGSFNKTEAFLRSMKNMDVLTILDKYGRIGVDALASATPRDSGITASSWVHTIEKKGARYSIVWRNTNVVSGLPVAILIQYGHGTGTGGYVEGTDYINPVIRPLFDKIADEVWEMVKRG